MDGITYLVPVLCSRLSDLQNVELQFGFDLEFLWKLVTAHTKRLYREAVPRTASYHLPEDFKGGLSDIFDDAAYLVTIAAFRRDELAQIREINRYDEDWQIYVDYADWLTGTPVSS